MLSEEEIILLIKEEPRLLCKDGKTLNTWRLIMGESVIPQFDIKYMEVILSDELVTLYEIDNGVGYDEDGRTYDLDDIIKSNNAIKILDIDASIYFEQKYLPNLEIIEDVIYYPKEYRYVTLAYLLNSEAHPIYINSLPLFDHTKVKYKFKNDIVVGVDNYRKILKSIEYMNCCLMPDNNGMVKIAYDIEVPYTMFYNKNVNERLSGVIPSIPLLDHALVVDLG